MPPTAGGVAIATVLVAPARAARLPLCARSTASSLARLVSQLWNGIAVARLCANDAPHCAYDLTAIFAALSAPMPRLWLN